MTEDVTGTWEGKLVFGRLAPAYEAYGGAYDGYGHDLYIKEAGDLDEEHEVKLAITSQAGYREFGTLPGPRPLVSIISGQLDYLERYSDPVSGFVDSSGLVKLCFYIADPRGDRAFVGQLRQRGLQRDISGKVMFRTGPGTGWNEQTTTYLFATLNVQKYGISFDERAYTVDYGHVF